MTDTSPRPPANVQDLVKAWRVSGRKAQVLESRLQQAVEVARRYRRDLLRLAEQNRTRKVQAEGLQQKVLELLERKQPAPAEPTPELEPLPDEAEQVSAEYVRHLLQRLREAHDLVEEFETLLEFREKQVHELLSRGSGEGEVSPDWRVAALQRELTDARHRIRMLTQELAQQPQAGDGERVRELEQQLAEVMSRGDAALTAQLQHKDAQIAQLQEQLSIRFDELKKAVTTIQSARERIKVLEQELEQARIATGTAPEENAELLEEITSLQDEIARLQEENEGLSSRRGAGTDPQVEQRLAAVEAENAQLKAVAERSGRLEAAVVDLRQKLQLAGSKYQEVKAAFIEKHQQLVELQNRSVELEKSGQAMEPMVRTLEAALEETRRQNGVLQRQLEEQRKRSEAAPAPSGEASEALASMETKLKEARRSAVRAQAEAGLKRKEVAKLQEEVEALKARLAQLGG